MNPFSLAAVGCLCGATLAALVLVLRHLANEAATARAHLVSMRATDSEIALLKAQWTEGSTAIAKSHAALDKKIGDIGDQLVNLRNRIGSK